MLVVTKKLWKIMSLDLLKRKKKKKEKKEEDPIVRT